MSTPTQGSPQNRQTTTSMSCSPGLKNVDPTKESVEESNPLEDKRTRKRTSNVWDNFEYVDTPNIGLRHQCKHFFKIQKTGTTTHLKNHLNTCLQKKLYNQKQRLLNFQREGSSLDERVSGPLLLPSSSKFDPLKTREAMAHWIMMHEHPFTICEEEGFIYMMRTANLGYETISRKTAKDDCMIIYDREKNKLKEVLKGVTRISLTTDLWKSQNQKIEYMVITGHFVDNDWSLQKRVLSFVHVPPPRCGVDIADVMHKCLKDWGIESKVFTVSVDNASYNDVCLRILKRNLSRNRKLVCSGKMFQVRCCAHILNLLVQDGISIIEPIIENVRESVKYINHSEARLKSFSEVVQQLQLGQKKMIIDVPTRWNSTFFMLKAALKFKDAFPMYKERDPNYDCVPELEEWDKVEKVCKVLEVFNAATNLISGSEYPTSNLYLGEVYRIKEVLDDAIREDDFFIQEMSQKMKEKFDKYWGECNLLMTVASVMDPRVKMGAVEYCYPKIYGQAQSQIYIQDVKEDLQEIFMEYVEMYNVNDNSVDGECNSVEGSSSGTSTSTQQLEGTSSGWNKIFRFVRSKDTIPASKSELETYLEEHVYICDISIMSRFNALDWWKTNQLKYRILSRMAADILAIPISTVASESTFSAGGRVIDPYRANLAPETVQALICGGDWMRKAHGIKKKRKVEDELKEIEVMLPDP